LPTPTVSDTFTAGLASTQQSDGSLHSVSLAQIVNRADLLPTPNTFDSLPARTGEAYERVKNAGGRKNRLNSGNLREAIAHDLLPTPKALDGIKGNLKTSQERIEAGNQIDLPNVAVDIALRLDLMGTPRTSTKNGSSTSQVEAGAPKSRIEDQVLTDNWGRFAPAIERWEEVINRPAPPATKPDGKDGAHRLSENFTEWLMGLPDGWITGVGLTRAEALKACGNGVVPQQAALALRVLLQDTQIEGITK